MSLKNEVLIRNAAPEDAEGLLAIYTPYVTGTAVSFEYEPPGLEEFQSRMAGTMESYPYLVAEEKGETVGYAYADPVHPRAAYRYCAEVTIYLRQDRRGEGLGRALYARLEEELKARGIRNLYACIGSPREKGDPYLTQASEKFHARMGYRLAGRFEACGYKFGRWYDMVWMEKMLCGQEER